MSPGEIFSIFDFLTVCSFDPKATKREEDFFPLGEAVGLNLLEEGRIYGLFFS
jgi:hypothetical protein